MLSQCLTIGLNVGIITCGVVQIQSAQVQLKQILGFSGQSKLIGIGCVVLENVNSKTSTHISEALEQTAQSLADKHILNDTSDVQIVIVHIEAVLHVAAQSGGVTVPCNDFIHEGLHVAGIRKGILVSKGRLGCTVEVDKVNQLAVQVAQLQGLALELHNQVIGQVLDVDDNDLGIGIPFQDLLDDGIEVTDSSQGCIGQDVNHQIHFRSQGLAIGGHVLLQHFLHLSSDFCAVFLRHQLFGDSIPLGCLPEVAISQNGLDVIESINTKVVPAQVNGDVLSLGQIVLVCCSQSGHAAGLSNCEPLLAAGEAPLHVSVIHISVLFTQQIQNFISSHGTDGQLMQLRTQSLCNLCRVGFLGSHLIAVDVHFCLTCCQRVL